MSGDGITRPEIDRTAAASTGEISTAGSSRFIVLALCALIAAVDGFDTQAIGYTGRLIAADFGFPLSALGSVFSAGLLGTAIGGATFGHLADRYGRKPLLVISTAVIAVFTYATIITNSYTGLLICRFVTGLGLGGATPCFIALAAETVSVRSRAATITMLYAAFPLGGTAGALGSAWLLTQFSWHSVFMLGAVSPAVAAIVTIAALTEPHRSRAARDEATGETDGVRGFFGRDQGAITLSLWSMFFLAYMSIIVLALWTPPLLQSLGVSAAATGVLVACVNGGSVIGSALSGFLIQRWNGVKVLIPAFALGAILWGAITLFHTDPKALIVLTFFAGLVIGGSATGLLAVAAAAYPAARRSTGVGFAIGFARFGQVVGPLVIGALVHAAWDTDTIFMACAAPSLLAILPAIIFRYANRQPKGIGASD